MITRIALSVEVMQAVNRYLPCPCKFQRLAGSKDSRFLCTFAVKIVTADRKRIQATPPLRDQHANTGVPDYQISRSITSGAVVDHLHAIGGQSEDNRSISFQHRSCSLV